MRPLRPALTAALRRFRRSVHPVIGTAVVVSSVPAIVQTLTGPGFGPSRIGVAGALMLAAFAVCAPFAAAFPNRGTWVHLIASIGMLTVFEPSPPGTIALPITTCLFSVAYLHGLYGLIPSGAYLTAVLILSAATGKAGPVADSLPGLAAFLVPFAVGFAARLYRQQRANAAVLRRRLDHERTAGWLHDTISNNLAYMILRVDRTLDDGAAHDEAYYRGELDALRAMLRRSLDATHQAIAALEDRPDAGPSEARPRSAPGPAADRDAAAETERQRMRLLDLIGDGDGRLRALGFDGESLLGDNDDGPLDARRQRLLADVTAELYANIAKHADPAQGYALTVSYGSDAVVVQSSNGVSAPPRRSESDAAGPAESAESGSGDESERRDGRGPRDDGPGSQAGRETRDGSGLGLHSGLDRYAAVLGRIGGTVTRTRSDGLWDVAVTIPRK